MHQRMMESWSGDTAREARLTWVGHVPKRVGEHIGGRMQAWRKSKEDICGCSERGHEVRRYRGLNRGS